MRVWNWWLTIRSFRVRLVIPPFRDLRYAPGFRNLQHRLADRIFDWAQVELFMSKLRPTMKTCVLLSAGASPSKAPSSCRGAKRTLSFHSSARKTYPV